jgi:hypothetical protein
VISAGTTSGVLALGGVLTPAARGGLGFLSHREDVLARHLSGQLGVSFADVLLDLADELGFGLCPDDLAALAVDDLRHGSSLR